MQRIADLLMRCGTETQVMPPTQLYNEGWMLRLILDWHARKKHSSSVFKFLNGSSWYSEALLPSQFRARSRGDELAEAWTHADGIVGHYYAIDGRGDIRLRPDATQLVVTEAKMFSGLSTGTKRAKTFDQAARNVACMAELIHLAQLSPDQFTSLGFVVLAPQEQIDRGVFEEQLRKEAITAKVLERVTSYQQEPEWLIKKQAWFEQSFLPALNRVELCLFSWEDAIREIDGVDPVEAAPVSDFYQMCLRFNRPRRMTPVV